MDIKEAVEEKEILEKKIAELLDEFTANTGLTVDFINILIPNIVRVTKDLRENIIIYNVSTEIHL
jgi:hypothetical protein